jgi:hypothetical protein
MGYKWLSTFELKLVNFLKCFYDCLRELSSNEKVIHIYSYLIV